MAEYTEMPIFSNVGAGENRAFATIGAVPL